MYALQEGVYIKFSAEDRLRQDPPHKIEACIVRVECAGSKTLIEEKECAAVRYRDSWWLRANNEIPDHFYDIHEALPRYHCYPWLNFDKVYSEQQHIKLLEFVKRRKRIVEEEEDE